MLLGAGIGLITNGLTNLANGEKFFDGAGRAALFGATSAALSFGIGEVAGQLFGKGLSLGKAAFQAGAHGLSGAMMSAIQGGNF